MYRRMAFNVVARNRDDHTRNIAFLMGPDGMWRLAPAFDVVWAYNSKGTWTNRHQMTVNGKRDDIERTDLLAVANNPRKLLHLTARFCRFSCTDHELPVIDVSRCESRLTIRKVVVPLALEFLVETHAS